MGEDMYYAWTVTNKDGTKGLIEGMSIDGAEVLYRNFQNVGQIWEEEEGPTHWRFIASVVDWEKGVVTTRLFRQRKGERHGKFDADRALDIAYQIGQSKAMRNAIVHFMPEWLKRDAMATAKKKELERYADVPAGIRRMCSVARQLGITDAEIIARAGKSYVVQPSGEVQHANWTPMDLMHVSAIFRAIIKKESSVDAEFRGKAPPAPDADSGPPPPTTPAAPSTTGEPPPIVRVQEPESFGGLPIMAEPTTVTPAVTTAATEPAAATTTSEPAPAVPPLTTPATTATTAPHAPATAPAAAAAPAPFTPPEAKAPVTPKRRTPSQGEG